MPSVQHPRGTAASLAALAAANGLLPGQIYLITDQGRLAVALTASTYETFAKLSETGGEFGDGTGNAAIDIDGGDGFVKSVFFKTGGLTRWRLYSSSGAESGGNAGSDMKLWAFNDAGTSLGQVFTVNRATQVMDFVQPPTVGGNPITNGFSHGVLAPIAGAFISNAVNGTALTSVAQVADRVTIGAYIPRLAQTIDQLGCSISTLLAASNVKLVLYDSDANGRPTTILRETANIDSATTGTKFASISPFTFEPGKVYYLGLRSSSTQSIRTISAAAGHVLATTNAATPVLQTALTKTEAFASAAADWTYANSQLSNLSPPLILMRVA